MNTAEGPPPSHPGRTTVTDARVVYVVEGDGTLPGRRQLDLAALFGLLRRSWLLVASGAVLGMLLAAGHGWLTADWYRAQALLAPAAEKQGGVAASLGMLAPFGALLPSSERTVEAVAILKSREFARAFIEAEQLSAPLREGYRLAGLLGRLAPGPDDELLDEAELARFFSERVLRVREEVATGLVTLEVEWHVAEQSALWANRLVRHLNRLMRERALAEAALNVDFLREELATTSVLPLQQSIGTLLEAELQKLMLARGNEEYAFRMLDPAVTPRKPARPQRVLILVAGLMAGGLLGLSMALLRSHGDAGEGE